MQTQSIALQNFLSLLRAIGAFIGALLVGHAYFGHTVSTDTLQVFGGAALTLATLIWGFATKTSTIEAVESSIRSIVAALGGVGVSAGLITGQQLATALAAIIPVAVYVQSVISKYKNKAIASGAAKVSPTTNKVVTMLAVLLCLGTMASAQTPCSVPADSAKYIKAGVWNWSVDEMKEAAKGLYFQMWDNMSDKSAKYDSTIVDRFFFWRTAVDLKLSEKKDRDDFHNWLVAEARAAGKLKYEKKSE